MNTNFVICGKDADSKKRLEELANNSGLDFVYTAERKKSIFRDRAIIIGGKNNGFYKLISDYNTGKILKETKLKLKEVEPYAKAAFNKYIWIYQGF